VFERLRLLPLFINFWENPLFVRGYLEFRWDEEFEMVFVLKQKEKHIFLVTLHNKLRKDDMKYGFFIMQ
jgi:uncharacterized secreted protein with C-terminal beta-propeller domain